MRMQPVYGVVIAGGLIATALADDRHVGGITAPPATPNLVATSTDVATSDFEANGDAQFGGDFKLANTGAAAATLLEGMVMFAQRDGWILDGWDISDKGEIFKSLTNTTLGAGKTR